MEQLLSKDCSICLEPLSVSSNANSILLKTPCDHVFHHLCLSEWFRSGVPGNYCPLCKRTMMGSEAVAVSPSGNELSTFELLDPPPFTQIEDSALVQQREQGAFSEEELQRLQEHFSEMEQEFTGMQTHFVASNQSNLELQQFVSASMLSLSVSSQEQEVVDSIWQSLSETNASLSDAERNISQALETLAEIRQRDSGSLDRNDIGQIMANLETLYDRACDQGNNASASSQNLRSILNTFIEEHCNN